MSHTEGKLSVCSEDGTLIRQANGDAIADTLWSSGFDEANARRLVACWNYCIGMSIEHLEAKHDWKIEARVLTKNGELVRAVKHCRAKTGWGLKEAVDAIKLLQQETS
jgi:hypothetical protein